MLRLVIDVEGLSLEDDPRVVYLGHSAQKAQEAIDASSSAKLGMCEIPVLRRAKKTAIVEPHPATVAPAPTKDETKDMELLLDNLTIAELKEVAKEEGVDVSDCEHKKDFVAAISLHRSAKAE